ncbi:wide host range VirA protein [Maritalea myrionectae]|uniref:histidine kinase n=2 Tax=Maritalea myrionectae TaxID=454601 RepID=A0A2R4MBN3_9HYPH|nr:wide host range VirA protein [Maritalea myrionectae]
MRRDFDPTDEKSKIGKTVLLIGAGCSQSAGIPLAREISQSLICNLAKSYGVVEQQTDDPDRALKKLVEAGHFQNHAIKGSEDIDWSSVYDEIFSSHFNTPKEVYRIFNNIFDENGRAINWTHICIGELVRLGYVSSILTTNFDQLALEGIARTGRLPIVADGLENLGRISGESKQPQLIQIHGSRHTYHLINSVEDTDALSNDASARQAIDELFRTATTFVVVGYGGREKGIMKLLIEAGKRYPQTRIFWSSYDQETSNLGPLVEDFLGTSQHSKIIAGLDSDTFFDSLLDELGVSTPKAIDDPLFMLRELTDSLAFTQQSSIAEKIKKLQIKTVDLRVAEKHMAALMPTEPDTETDSEIQKQKMQAVGELSARIAHDFNNFLTTIIGLTDLVLQGKSTNDSDYHDLVEVKNASNRAAALARQLLAFSRRQILNKQIVSLAELISDLTVLIRRLIGEKIEFMFVEPEDIWWVKLDHVQMEQAILNLIINARDAIDGTGKITINLKNFVWTEEDAKLDASLPPGEFVELQVEDTGVGIKPENLEKIFEPFFSTKELGKGSGLGLSTVYGIIMQSGGFIKVDSSLGKGADFRVYIPRYLPEPDEIPTYEEQVAKRQSHNLNGTEKILVVDDEPSVRDFLKRALADAGYNVVCATDGIDAMKTIAKDDTDFDLIIFDAVTPELEASAFVKTILKRNVNQKFLLVSSYAIENTAPVLEENQTLRFMSKPFSTVQLRNIVRDILDS